MEARDVGPGKILSTSDWEVIAASAEHVQPCLDSLAYRINTRAGSFVFTGATQPCESVTKLSKGADMMLRMCWDDQRVMEDAGES